MSAYHDITTTVDIIYCPVTMISPFIMLVQDVVGSVRVYLYMSFLHVLTKCGWWFVKNVHNLAYTKLTVPQTALPANRFIGRYILPIRHQLLRSSVGSGSIPTGDHIRVRIFSRCFWIGITIVRCQVEIFYFTSESFITYISLHTNIITYFCRPSTTLIEAGIAALWLMINVWVSPGNVKND